MIGDFQIESFGTHIFLIGNNPLPTKLCNYLWNYAAYEHWPLTFSILRKTDIHCIIVIVSILSTLISTSKDNVLFDCQSCNAGFTTALVSSLTMMKLYGEKSDLAPLFELYLLLRMSHCCVLLCPSLLFREVVNYVL